MPCHRMAMVESELKLTAAAAQQAEAAHLEEMGKVRQTGTMSLMPRLQVLLQLFPEFAQRVE